MESKLTSAQRAQLRSQGQTLNAALNIGREGLGTAVVRELDRLLTANELVKVRFVVADREEKAALSERIAADLRCECVGAVGHTALFFRQKGAEKGTSGQKGT